MKEAIIWSAEWATDLSKLKQNVDHIVQFIQASFTESFISESNEIELLSYTQSLFYSQTSFKPLQTLSSKEIKTQTTMVSNERADWTGQRTQEDHDFINTQQQKLTNLIAQVIAAAIVSQQADNIENNDENTVNESINSSTTPVIIL